MSITDIDTKHLLSSTNHTLLDTYITNKLSYIDLCKNHTILVGGDKSKSNTKSDITSKNVTETQLINIIKENTKAAYRASVDDNNNLINNIANKGLQKGEVAVRGSGEYQGIAIRALEEIRPVLTDVRMIRAIEHIKNNDMQKAIGVLRLTDEVYKLGIGVVYTVIVRWLEINDIHPPLNYLDRVIQLDKKIEDEISLWLESFNWGPVEGKFEIADIGSGKGYSVVPESWAGRVFSSARDLHEEMNRLDWRKGKPPVNYCVIYAMSIKENVKLHKFNTLPDVRCRIGVSVLFTDKLTTKIDIFSTQNEYKNWLQNIKDNSDYYDSDILVASLNTDNISDTIIVVFKYSDLFEDIPKYVKKRSVGLLVSMMQKMIRRGPICAKAFDEVLNEIWRSPGYNLPEQQFLRVNACRQLAWRLFVTSIEDVSAFVIDDSSNQSILSMTDLAMLSILANEIPDVQFNKKVFKLLRKTALIIQSISKKWSIMDRYKELNTEIELIDTKDNLLNSFTALYYYMPSREWDTKLLIGSYNAIKNTKTNPDKYDDIKPEHVKDVSDSVLLNKSTKEGERDATLAGMDMHPYPNLLILLQGSLSHLPYDNELHTTRALWGTIWYGSSDINYRLKPPKVSPLLTTWSDTTLSTLKTIQENLLYPGTVDKKLSMCLNEMPRTDAIKPQYIKERDDTPKSIKRLGFILMFGRTRPYYYKKKRYEIVMAGYDEAEPEALCKVKIYNKNEARYVDEDLRGEIQEEFLANFVEDVEIPIAPFGYRWVWGDQKKARVSFDLDKKNKGRFVIHVQGKEYSIKPYDAGEVIIKVEKIKPQKIPDKIKAIVERCLYVDKEDSTKCVSIFNDYEINMLMRSLHHMRYPIFSWVDIAVGSKLPADLWRSVYIKLFNNKNNEVQIGPVDGQGNSLRDSVHYLYEGTIWRIFNMFSMLYPDAIILTDAVKSLKFKIDPNTSGYIDLIDNLEHLSFTESNNSSTDKSSSIKVVDTIKIKTKLWDHQQSTREKIIKDIKTLGRRGFGDASDVGAGKTLTALAVMADLYNMLNKETKESGYSGYLVLLPTTYLYKTWSDEIDKHCLGFHKVFQNADGTLSEPLQKNSVLITTLGRMRDHPLTQSWIFVTIDECLSVQNKSALQTEEAWRQIITSKYGVLMASATFFRARFDKLFYMLKMLNTGLPETKEYLDAILAESIVSYIPKKKREWKIEYNPFKLTKKQRAEYEILASRETSSDQIYISLQNYLYENFDYIDAFSQVVQRCEKNKRRCLIYAKSKDEADHIAEEIKDVSRFPDTSGRHLVISYTEGTYGLNHLIYLDTIVTRFPEPDKLPQMKGRLDRPEQKSETLYIEYLYIDDTIDRAGMLRLEMANRFYNDYIMPLAEFYDVAVGRKNIKN